jgi:radical SAM superfamily enzyme YgiQ (UPF0313 family)
MKILLIQPPTENLITNYVPEEFEAQSFGRMPPLGLLYLATYLNIKSEKTHSIKILDCISDDIGYKELKDYLFDYKPDVVGISVSTFTLIDSLKTATLVKSVSNKIINVFGGYHVMVFPEETLQHACVDMIIIGEGEECFFKLMQKLNTNNYNFTDLKGFGYKNNGITIEKSINMINNLDDLPAIDRTLVNYKKHTCLLGKKGLGTLISTSRGCPYSCTFCYQPIKKFRYRSIGNILFEIEKCLSLGITDFFFTDDLFNVTSERLSNFSDEIINKNLNLSWSFRGRMNFNCLSEESLKKAKNAGCIKINFGVEAISNSILKKINKKITTNEIESAINMTNKAGIEVAINIILGLPGQSKKEILETIDYVCSRKIDYLEASILVPFPNTQVFVESLQKGLLDKDLWKNFAINPNKDFKTPFYEENISRAELIYLNRLIYRKFYFRFSYILARLLRIKSWKELLDHFKGGYMVFKSVIKHT